VAVGLPDIQLRALAAYVERCRTAAPGFRWVSAENLHLTLRFIGEVDGRDAAMLDDALASIVAPAFDLELHGVGQFGNKQPHTLWAAARRRPSRIGS